MNLAFKILCPILIVGGLFSIHSNNAAGQTMDYFYDPSFAPESIVGGNGSSVTSILIHEDGRYTVSGGFQFNWPFNIDFIARFQDNGQIDQSFNSIIDGVSISYIQFLNNGYITQGGRLAFVGFDGSLPYGYHFLDYSHDPYKPDTWPLPTVGHIQVMDNIKIIVAGRFSPDTTNLEDRRHLVRVCSDGSPDPSFEPLKCHEPYDAYIIDLYPTPDGKWMITGKFMDIEGFESPGIARLHADFNVDTTFHSPFPDHTWNVRIIPGSHPQKLSGAIDEQNRMYVRFIDPGLAFPNPLNGLGHYRLLPNGNVDSTFQLGVITYLDYFGDWGEGGYYPGSIYTMAFEPDGSLIVGGRFRTIEGQPRGNIAKINEDGSLMEGVFHRQGADTANWQNGNNPDIDVPHISRIVRLDNGGLMVGGSFSRYDGHDQWGVVRLLPSPVGMEEKAANHYPLTCFPNPANSHIRVQLPDDIKVENLSVQIYSIPGQLMVEEVLPHSRQPGIHTHELPGGTYFLRVTSGELIGIGQFVIIK